MKAKARYIPALHVHWLTPFYDRMTAWIMPDRELKQQLLEQARVQAQYRVLDLCCGTATLALLIKQRHPDAVVAGLDIDSQILRLARRKVHEAGVEIGLHQGAASRLPYPDGYFDRVFFSFALHHLTLADKRRATAEVLRVLRSGGELHVLDFGKPHNLYSLAISSVVRWAEELADNMRGLLPQIFRDAGFIEVEECSRRTVVSGTVALYRARKP